MICVFVSVCMRNEKEIVFVYGNYRDNLFWTFCADTSSRRERTSEEKRWDFLSFKHLFQSTRALVLPEKLQPGRRWTCHKRPSWCRMDDSAFTKDIVA